MNKNEHLLQAAHAEVWVRYRIIDVYGDVISYWHTYCLGKEQAEGLAEIICYANMKYRSFTISLGDVSQANGHPNAHLMIKFPFENHTRPLCTVKSLCF